MLNAAAITQVELPSALPETKGESIPLDANGEATSLEEGSDEASFSNLLARAFGDALEQEVLAQDAGAEAADDLPPENSLAAFEAEETGTEDAPAENAPAEIAPAEIAPAEIVPAEIVPAELAPAELAPAELAPAEDPQARELPIDIVLAAPAENEEETEDAELPPAASDELATDSALAEGRAPAEGATTMAADLSGSEKDGGDSGRRTGTPPAASHTETPAAPTILHSASDQEVTLARIPRFESDSGAQSQTQSSSARTAEAVEGAATGAPQAEAETSSQGESGTQGRFDDRLAEFARLAQPQDKPEATAARSEPSISPTPPAEVQGGERATLQLRALPELPVENETQIVQQVRVLAQDGGGRARIQLQPPQLGGLDLRLTVMNDVVQLSVVADRGAVAELLARHLPELRMALETHGLQIDRVEVDVRDEETSEPRSRDSASDEHSDEGKRSETTQRSQEALLAEAASSAQPRTLNTLAAIDVHV